MNLQTDLTCMGHNAQNTGISKDHIVDPEEHKGSLSGVGTETAEGAGTSHFQITLDDGRPLNTMRSESCMLRVEPRTINDDGLD